MTDDAHYIARVTWDDPTTGDSYEYLLGEGATATIGRLDACDIAIREQHVSRQHAVINYRDGVFMITDLGSVNGVYVNDQRITEPYPLMAGDVIRLYVPVMRFDTVDVNVDSPSLAEHRTLITATTPTGRAHLLVTNGPQEGNTIPLLVSRVTVGRATSKADWEICLQDPSVSRPHARMELIEGTWMLYDLGSANGTFVNGTAINEKGRNLRDGDVVTFGSTLTLFRMGQGG